ncbi:MAG TPA: TetR/AcrR family transcriptional regulator [Pseudonocardia sp.]|nr:TetR/AcrR family transcriptional regulator [Pseudonocardia sp.]
MASVAEIPERLPSPDRPAAVRRRPRDRKAQIVAAAARLFWERGYSQVGMADIAGAVGIGASALYRHFRGKGDLLAAVLTESLTELERVLAESTDLAGQLRGTAGVVLAHREYAALWERAPGQLPARELDELAARHRAALDRLTATVTGALAGRGITGPAEVALRTRAVSSVLQSPSQHRTQLDPDHFVALLHRAASAVLTAPLPESGALTGPGAPKDPQLPASRREALLAAASTLFAERGYPAVSLDDIGAAIGIAGPSVYNHFPSKADVLLSVLHRGNEALWFALHQALAAAEGPADALGRLLDSYVAIMAGNPEIITVLLNEAASLPGEQRADFRRTQRDYVAEWVALLRRSRAELSEPAARVLVHTALGLVNSLCRSRPTPGRIPLEADLSALCRAVLRT